MKYLRNKISFEISPNPDTADYQVRIFIDKRDVLGDEYLGLDPEPFFEQDFEQEGDLYIGRCLCGVEGCDDMLINVTFQNNMVLWRGDNGFNFQFDKHEYANTIDITKNDYSWEDKERRLERIISEILKHTEIENDFSFAWASTQFEENTITLSYHKESEQQLYHIAWDGKSEDDAIKSVIEFLKENS